MAKSVNKVILIGNLGKDPELRYTPSGTAVASFSLATNERYKDKEGNWQDRTEWHKIVAWQRLAEIAGEYLKKGRTCYIEGRLQTRSWDDKESGQKKYSTEIVASDLVLLGGQRDKDKVVAITTKKPHPRDPAPPQQVRYRLTTTPAAKASPTTTYRSRRANSCGAADLGCHFSVWLACVARTFLSAHSFSGAGSQCRFKSEKSV